MAHSNAAPVTSTYPPSTSATLNALSWALAALALLTVLFLLQENGQLLSAAAAQQLHELTHDARHALGVPCH